mmetsp:Transcript_39186/g.84354  ORF Transcript_39186/g.84354 Transcript_39186/m.84354 type:complete len:282 (-) Transcript_39186:1997-2842(-)
MHRARPASSALLLLEQRGSSPVLSQNDQNGSPRSPSQTVTSLLTSCRDGAPLKGFAANLVPFRIQMKADSPSIALATLPPRTPRTPWQGWNFAAPPILHGGLQAPEPPACAAADFCDVGRALHPPSVRPLEIMTEIPHASGAKICCLAAALPPPGRWMAERPPATYGQRAQRWILMRWVKRPTSSPQRTSASTSPLPLEAVAASWASSQAADSEALGSFWPLPFQRPSANCLAACVVSVALRLTTDQASLRVNWRTCPNLSCGDQGPPMPQKSSTRPALLT